MEATAAVANRAGLTSFGSGSTVTLTSRLLPHAVAVAVTARMFVPLQVHIVLPWLREEGGHPRRPSREGERGSQPAVSGMALE